MSMPCTMRALFQYQNDIVVTSTFGVKINCLHKYFLTTPNAKFFKDDFGPQKCM